jgi:murein L,D-transpeptidase YcbB/YkuD
MAASRVLATGACALLLSTAGLACRSGQEIANRIEEILGGVSDRGGRSEPDRDEIRQALERQLRTAPVPAQGADRPSSPAFPTRRTLVDFYARRAQRLAWCSESGGILPEAEALLKALRNAGDDGLDPGLYAVAQLERLRDAMGARGGAEAPVTQWADFDLLMTTAFFRYASDLTTGRVHPDEIRSEWMTEPPELDLAGALDGALADHSLPKLLESLPPPHPGYDRLRDALKELRRTAGDGGWPAIPAGPALKKGARGERVALLKKRLGTASEGTRGVVGVSTRGRAAPRGGAPASPVFDGRLEDAVRVFQERHGLDPDGVVGAATLAALNVPVAERIRQVELNLERWRWIPRRLGDTHIEVNIPGFDLVLVKNGQPALESRIVAGSAFTPTPVFTDKVVAIIANPSWNVPHELAVREYLPELKTDPKLFERHGIRIFEADEKQDSTKARRKKGKEEDEAREIDPRSVSWRRVDPDEFDYTLRQDPGPDNALGRMKFVLTNDFQIYLHDTPARSAFEEASRDLSHGCIRVERAHDLAEALLGDDAERLEEDLGTTDEKSIPLRQPVPIQILYLTAWVDPDGGLRFGPDVYRFDPPQQEALARMSREASSSNKR